MNQEKIRVEIIRHWRNSNDHRIHACRLAAQLDAEGVTGLALDLHVEKQTVRNMRAAGKAYDWLIPYEVKVQEWAEALGYSFLKTLGFLHESTDLTPQIRHLILSQEPPSSPSIPSAIISGLCPMQSLIISPNES